MSRTRADDSTGAGSSIGDVFEDLEAEEERLEHLLEALNEREWATRSGAAGWSIADVVLHLAQTEEAVAAALTETEPTSFSFDDPASADDRMAKAVAAERQTAGNGFDRWRSARRGALSLLANAPPDLAVRWIVTPLRPRVLATTRLAEHWAHGLDIAEPLQLNFPDTVRLHHIAWLAHRALPWALSAAGADLAEVSCNLIGPDGDSW